MKRYFKNQYLKIGVRNRLIYLFFFQILYFDLSAQTITMSFPQSTSYVNTIPVVWSISPSNTVVSEITMTLTYRSGYYSNISPIYILKLKSTAASGRFTMSPKTIGSDLVNFINPPEKILDGSYSVKLTFKRSDGSLFSSSTAIISSSTETLPPVVAKPLANVRVPKIFNLKYTLASTPRLSGIPVTLEFIGSQDNAVLNMSSATNVDFQLNTSNLGSNTVYVRSLTGSSSLRDGAYKMVLGYFDASGHAAAYDTVNIILDTQTDPATFINPISGSLNQDQLTMNINLPEIPSNQSGVLLFNTGDKLDSIVLNNLQKGTNEFSLNLNNIATSSYVNTTSTSQLSTNIYSITFKYQDTLLNGFSSVNVSNVRLNYLTPTISSTAASSITNATASSGGNVTSDGGASVTVRGVCWSTSVNPTILDSKTSDGTGTGSFSSSLTGLTGLTTYHYRAYATNSVGTSYGDDLTFTTISAGPTTFVSTTTGSWYSAGSWVSNAVPTTTDNATVLNSHNITINSNTTINNLRINSGAIVTVTGTAVLTINGDLYDGLGTFSIAPGAKVLLKGNILNNQGNIKVVNTSTNGLEIKGNVDVPQVND